MVYRQMLHIRQCKGLIGYFAGGPREKFYRFFTDMMIIVAYVYLCHGVTFM